MKLKYAHDDCGANGRPGKLLCVFKSKADKLLSMIMSQAKNKKVKTPFKG